MIFTRQWNAEREREWVELLVIEKLIRRCIVTSSFWRGKQTGNTWLLCYFCYYSKSILKFTSTEAQCNKKYHKKPRSQSLEQSKQMWRSVHPESVTQTNFNKRKKEKVIIGFFLCYVVGSHRNPRMVLAASNNGRNCSVVSLSSLTPLARQLTLMRLA